MRFIGDVHGHIGEYLKVRGTGPSFQLGDMGFGFAGVAIPDSTGIHRFIRGNHDDPQMCANHPDYAGDSGYDPELRLFYLGGAYSIDFAWRQARMRHDPTPIWWSDEQQSDAELEKAIEAYREAKPEIVATHECPEMISQHILGKMLVGFRPEKLVSTRTGRALQRMFQSHQPRLWLFGHYHVDIAVEIEGTEFWCLNELSTHDV